MSILGFKDSLENFSLEIRQRIFDIMVESIDKEVKRNKREFILMMSLGVFCIISLIILYYLGK